MICDAGDVIVVPFPFVDVGADKRRPSLVLSRRGFNRTHGHSVCAMITTARQTRWPSDIAITDLTAAGLQLPCVVRWKLFTLPNGIIVRKAGKLGSADYKEIVAAGHEILV